MGDIIFITGGARSGKSKFAEDMAASRGGDIGYLATAQALDEEMQQRIVAHQRRRPANWETIEEPLDISSRIKIIAPKSVIILDCLTLWMNNMLGADYADAAIFAEAEVTVKAMNDHLADFLVVSNEVGWGIVPENPLARRFRDLAGYVNTVFAAAATGAWLVVAGIPVKLK